MVAWDFGAFKELENLLTIKKALTQQLGFTTQWTLIMDGGQTTNVLTTLRSSTPSLASCRSVTNFAVRSPKLFSCLLGVWSEYGFTSCSLLSTRTMSMPCMAVLLCLKLRYVDLRCIVGKPVSSRWRLACNERKCEVLGIMQTPSEDTR